jgi:hypothetical protein
MQQGAEFWKFAADSGATALAWVTAGENGPFMRGFNMASFHARGWPVIEEIAGDRRFRSK